MDATSFNFRHIVARAYIGTMQWGLGDTGKKQVVLAIFSAIRLWRAAEHLGHNDYLALASRLHLRDVAYDTDGVVVEQLQKYFNIWGNDLDSVVALEHAVAPKVFKVDGLPPRGAYTALQDPEPVRSDLPSADIISWAGAVFAVQSGDARKDDSRPIREVCDTADDIFSQVQDPSAVAMALLDAQLTPLPTSAWPGAKGPGWPLEQDLFLLEAVSNGSSMWECTRRMNAKGAAVQGGGWLPRSIAVVKNRVDLLLWGTAQIDEWRKVPIASRFTESNHSTATSSR